VYFFLSGCKLGLSESNPCRFSGRYIFAGLEKASSLEMREKEIEQDINAYRETTVIKKSDSRVESETVVTPTYASRGLDSSAPKYKLSEKGMPPRTAYQLVHDELMLDGNAHMNLATFVTTWMEPEAVQLMSETFEKNMIDKDEYPQMAEIEKRCVTMLASLRNAPDPSTTMGTSTIGSRT
jgi:glutamate/tyrosine decarboxylase-like PLP-dependent enzyme